MNQLNIRSDVREIFGKFRANFFYQFIAIITLSSDNKFCAVVSVSFRRNSQNKSRRVSANIVNKIIKVIMIISKKFSETI